VTEGSSTVDLPSIVARIIDSARAIWWIFKSLQSSLFSLLRLLDACSQSSTRIYTAVTSRSSANILSREGKQPPLLAFTPKYLHVLLCSSIVNFDRIAPWPDLFNAAVLFPIHKARRRDRDAALQLKRQGCFLRHGAFLCRPTGGYFNYSHSEKIILCRYNRCSESMWSRSFLRSAG